METAVTILGLAVIIGAISGFIMGMKLRALRKRVAVMERAFIEVLDAVAGETLKKLPPGDPRALVLRNFRTLVERATWES